MRVDKEEMKIKTSCLFFVKSSQSNHQNRSSAYSKLSWKSPFHCFISTFYGRCTQLGSQLLLNHCTHRSVPTDPHMFLLRFVSLLEKFIISIVAWWPLSLEIIFFEDSHWEEMRRNLSLEYLSWWQLGLVPQFKRNQDHQDTQYLKQGGFGQYDGTF